MVQRLGREGEVDPLGLEALHDLEVDPGVVLQIVPVFGRVAVDSTEEACGALVLSTTSGAVSQVDVNRIINLPT